MATRKPAHLRVEIGTRLRNLRVGAGITSQMRLGELAGVDRTYIGRLERGESGVTIDSLAAITAAMGVSLAEFFEAFNKPVRPQTPRKRS